MVRLIILVCLVFAEILMVQVAMGYKSMDSEVNPLKIEAHYMKFDHQANGVGHQPSSAPSESLDSGDESSVAEGPAIRRLGKHHSSDKSVAGGGVIIGGLVTAIFATVFCYIRVTRRKDDAAH